MKVHAIVLTGSDDIGVPVHQWQFLDRFLYRRICISLSELFLYESH